MTRVAIRAPLEQGGPISQAVSSRDMRTVVTASKEGLAHVWDVETGKERARLQHQGAINKIDISSDGRLLITASDDHTARVWDAFTGKEKARLQHDAEVKTVAIDPSRSIVLSASEKNSSTQKISTWDVETARERAHFDLVDVSSIILTKDLVLISYGPMVNSETISISRQGGKDLLELKQPGIITSATITPDGTKLVVASQNIVRSFLRVWNPSTGKEIARPTYDGIVDAIGMSPDGKWFGTASSDRSARLFDLETGRELAIFRHQASVTSISVSLDAKQIATTSEDNSVRVWNVSGEEILRLQFDNEPKALGFTQ